MAADSASAIPIARCGGSSACSNFLPTNSGANHREDAYGHEDQLSAAGRVPAAGYLAKAGRAKAPGVVVIQEWWGLQDQIKGICDRFALAGYEALAPTSTPARSFPITTPMQPAAR